MRCGQSDAGSSGDPLDALLAQLGDGGDQRGEPGGQRRQPSGGGEVVLGDDAEGHSGELGEGGIGGFEGGAAGAKLSKAGLRAGAGDVGGLAVQAEGIALGGWVGGGAGGGCEGAEVGLGEGHGEGGVSGEVELGIALAPVLDQGDVRVGPRRRRSHVGLTSVVQVRGAPAARSASTTADSEHLAGASGAAIPALLAILAVAVVAVISASGDDNKIPASP